MKRKSFDRIVTAIGFGLAVFLLIAAGLLNWVQALHLIQLALN